MRWWKFRDINKVFERFEYFEFVVESYSKKGGRCYALCYTCLGFASCSQLYGVKCETCLCVCGVYQKGGVGKSEIIICNGHNDSTSHSIVVKRQKKGGG